MNNTQPTDNIQAWIEDGVLYNKYATQINLQTIVEAQQQSVALLDEQHLQVVPTIIVLEGEAQSNVKLSLAEMGKIVNTVDIMKRLSNIWIVGASATEQSLGAIANKFFFANRIHFVQTLPEAKAAAMNAAHELPILEAK